MPSTVVGARDVPCPVCKQPVGEPCIYASKEDLLGLEMTRSHVARIWAADDVQRAARVLLDED